METSGRCMVLSSQLRLMSIPVNRGSRTKSTTKSKHAIALKPPLKLAKQNSYTMFTQLRKRNVESPKRIAAFRVKEVKERIGTNLCHRCIRNIELINHRQHVFEITNSDKLLNKNVIQLKVAGELQHLQLLAIIRRLERIY